MKSSLNWAAAAASLLGLFFIFYDPRGGLSTAQWIIVAAIVAVFIYVAIRDVRDEISKRPKTYTDKNQINNYMFNLLKKSGNCTIYTRDASWARDEKIFDLLRQKAGRKELTFFMPKRTDHCDELERLGAKIVEYSKLDMLPSVRFTIANAGRTSDAFVAVGRMQEGKHLIEEFNSTHPTYAMANDLIHVLVKADGNS